MIKQVEINNFQSHKHTIINFDSGVNIFTGSSDCGKSAIIRAIRWVVYGKPRGDGFRSHWGGDTRVKITLDNDDYVERVRTNAEGIYILSLSGKKTEFRAFGNDIPVEVVQALNFDEYNLQQQSDSPFLISNTAGEVATHFNNMANLEQIGSSLRYVQSEIRQITQDIGYKETEIIGLKEKYKSYLYLGEAEKDVEVILTKQKELEGIKEATQILIVLETQIKNLNQYIEDIQKQVDAEKLINGIIAKQKALEVLEKDMRKISILKNQISRTEKEIETKGGLVKSETLINQLTTKTKETSDLNKQKTKINTLRGSIVEISHRIDLIGMLLPSEKIIAEIARKRAEMESGQKYISKMRVLQTSGISLENRILSTQNILKGLEKEYETNFPDICPVCGNKGGHQHDN